MNADEVFGKLETKRTLTNRKRKFKFLFDIIRKVEVEKLDEGKRESWKQRMTSLASLWNGWQYRY